MSCANSKLCITVDECCKIICTTIGGGPQFVGESVVMKDYSNGGAVEIITADGQKKRICGEDVLKVGESLITEEMTFEILFEALLAQQAICKNTLFTIPVDQPIEEGKKYEETIYRADPDNPKQDVAIVVMTDNETGELCYFLESDLSTEININEYEMGQENSLGSIVNNPNSINEIAKPNGIDICGGAAGKTITDADLAPFVEAFVADLTEKGVAIPEGAELGLSSLIVQTHSKGAEVHCDIDAADVTVTANSSAQVTFNDDEDQVNPNGGKRKYQNPLFDNGLCNGCVPLGCLVQEGSFEAVIPPGGAIHIDFCVVCAQDKPKA